MVSEYFQEAVDKIPHHKLLYKIQQLRAEDKVHK